MERLLADNGGNIDKELRSHMSLEKRVAPQTQRAFIWHSLNDPAVLVENSILLAQAFRLHGVPFELHIFEDGHHGMALDQEYPNVGLWPDLCAAWLKRAEFIS